MCREIIPRPFSKKIKKAYLWVNIPKSYIFCFLLFAKMRTVKGD